MTRKALNRGLTVVLALLALVVLAATGLKGHGLGGLTLLLLALVLWWGTARLPGRLAGRLSVAQLIFVWGLATSLAWGVLALYLLADVALESVGLTLALASFLALMVAIFVLLVRLSWPVMATAGGGHAIAAGALLWPIMFSWVVGALLLSGDIAESGLFRSSAAGAESLGAGGGVEWRRPLPGEWDFVRIDETDLNPRRDGSTFERISEAVVSISSDEALGSAFLITRDGLAITNHHVIDVEAPLVARFRDGRESPVRVVRADADVDAALLQVACDRDCLTVELELLREPAVGAEVLVVGTPYSEILSHTLTRGVVSGLRFVEGGTLIQVDAPVNPGNSGGPIVDAATGKVVAVVRLKLVDEAYEGLGFGIAIVDALRVLGVRWSAR